MNDTPNCRQCDSKNTMFEMLEQYRYDECGLPNVVLQGVPSVKCNDCENVSIMIPGMGQLHKVLATGIVEKQSRLVGDEIKFLREFLGWTNAKFSQRMGVAPSTSSRWVSGDQTMKETSELLLRVLVAASPPVNSYSEELFDGLDFGVSEVSGFKYSFVRDKCWRTPNATC